MRTGQNVERASTHSIYLKQESKSTYYVPSTSLGAVGRDEALPSRVSVHRETERLTSIVSTS